MTDSVGQYLNTIGQIPLLTKEQEVELAQTVEAGLAAKARIEAGESSAELRRAVRRGARAKEQFINSNLRLVVSIARRYPIPPSMELLDLVQEGNLGLEHAVDKFEWRKGFKFSTYATFWIRQAIGRALDQKASLVRLPGDRASKLRNALREANGEISELDPHQRELYNLTALTSIDRTVGDDHNASELIDFIADPELGPEDLTLLEFEGQYIDDLLSGLEPRARFAVELRFGLNDGERRSYREVGESLGVTSEAARRLIERALASVRSHTAA